jgi:hypothetical protein
MGIAEWIASGGVLAVAGFFLKELMKVKKEMADIKVNYLDRFADLKDTLKRDVKESHDSVITAIGDLRVDLAKNYCAKADCPVHK